MQPRRLLFVLTLALALPAWARKPGEPIKPGLNLFSKQQDIQLGREYANQIRRQVQVVDNRELQDYIGRLGRRLASQPEADDYPYTFTVVNERSINAFALPGGPAFVQTGLLAAADNEAQVAGVLAHEISHVALRHGTNQASKANFLQIPAILAGVITGSNLWAQLAQIGAVGVMLKFSRTAENQADLLGARLMNNAGYNPLELARFFEKLEAEGGSRAPQFLSDHPNPGNRVKAIEEEIRALPRRNYDASAGDFSRMKAIAVQFAGGPQVPTGPGGGAVVLPPPPTGGYRQLRGREFGLSYPDSWQVFGDNNAASMTIAPREGLIQTRNGVQVGYGAMVSYFFPKDSRARNLRGYTDELIHSLHAANPSIHTVSRDQRRLRVDGSSALVTTLASESPYPGQAEVDMLVTVERPEGVFYMVFIAPEREFRNLQRTFEDMLQSIRFSN
ncbi:MAG: M48 family metalloprotease [Acidobacteria bacterium]|nr:M48 family metalloprotease [Acidobacteriota bacterium]